MLIKKEKKLKPKTDKNVKKVIKKKEIKKKVKTENDGSKVKVKTKKRPTKQKMDADGEVAIELTKEHISNSLDAILKIAEEIQEQKKDLLGNESDRVIVQVNCVRIPKISRRFIRLNLPHSLVTPTDEVALFVPDLEKGLHQDYEKTIQHWEALLEREEVTEIKEIIPMNKVKTEYRQYEMVRKLARMFDFYLVDGRISGHLSHILSQTFERFAGPPSPVGISKSGKNIKSKIQAALKRTYMKVHGNGDCHTFRVGSIRMPKEEIIDNILGAWNELDKLYPGGTQNIRSILIKTRKSPSIPIYFNTVNKKDVEIPVVRPKRPKAFKTVEGELTTLAQGPTVKVSPSGSVNIVRTNKVKRKNDTKVDKIVKKKKKVESN